jgi:hypothetical protein
VVDQHDVGYVCPRQSKDLFESIVYLGVIIAIPNPNKSEERIDDDEACTSCGERVFQTA